MMIKQLELNILILILIEIDCIANMDCLICIIDIEGREHFGIYSVGMCLCAYEAVSFRLGMIEYMTKLYIFIPV